MSMSNALQCEFNAHLWKYFEIVHLLFTRDFHLQSTMLCFDGAPYVKQWTPPALEA